MKQFCWVRLLRPGRASADMENDTATTVPGVHAADKGHADRDTSSQHRQVLYIQMEFCPQTLRDVLDAGPLQEADAWQVRTCCEHDTALVIRTSG